MPDDEPTVAVVAVVLQVPPPDGLDKVILAVSHTVPAPVMAGGSALIVIVFVW